MTYVSAELHRRILALSGGCCEYCRVHESDVAAFFHIEHIVAEAHGGLTNENNLAYSCPSCNHHKGPNIAAADPETGEPTFLFHPRKHNWHEHFRLAGAYIEPLTPEERATEFVLRLNTVERLTQRADLIVLGSYPCFAE